MKAVFCGIFSEIRKDILKGLPKKKVGRNSKGDITKFFDKHAENKAIRLLGKKTKFNARIISEELSREIKITKKKGQPYNTVIIDPVDGSDNYALGIPFVCFGVAVFDPSFKPLYSFAGNYFTGDYIYADRKKIAFGMKKNDAGKRTAIITLSGIRKGNLCGFIKQYNRIRTMGATIGEMIMVAKGEAETFIDVRNRLTLENFAPFFLIARRTGSVLTDEKGKKIEIKTLSLSRGYNIVYSRSKAAHKSALKNLKKI